MANKISDNVKCKLSVTFNGILYNLKGAIMHRGETIEDGEYCGIFTMDKREMFPLADNMFDIEMIKNDPKKITLLDEAYLLLFEKNGISSMTEEQTECEHCTNQVTHECRHDRYMSPQPETSLPSQSVCETPPPKSPLPDIQNPKSPLPETPKSPLPDIQSPKSPLPEIPTSPQAGHITMPLSTTAYLEVLKARKASPIYPTFQQMLRLTNPSSV